jgi:hypothetical protein
MVHSLADYVVKAKALVAQMTLEEKALLLSGDGWWRTHRVDRLQIPSICMTDGARESRHDDQSVLWATCQSTRCARFLQVSSRKKG